MPFRALSEGEIVVPTMVPNQEPVSCPACGGTMYARSGTDRARHFYHVDDSAGDTCSGLADGESETHARCVALAVEALQETFDAQAARCSPEVEIDVSMGGSGNRTRRADALVEFISENPYFGKGLVVEVQHKHHEKDIDMTTHDYLSAGYSVVWLSSSDFGDEALDYAVVDEAFVSRDGSGYSVRECSPQQFLRCMSYQYSGEHNWGTVPSYVLTCENDYEICTSPECTLRRRYNEQHGEYDYNPKSITTPDLPLRVLRQTIVREHSITDFGEWLTQRYPNATLEKALADRPEIDRCSGPKGFHEWKAPTPVWENFCDQPKVELRACQHCSVHLLTDLRGYEDERTDLFFSECPDSEWDLLSLKADPWQCDNRSHEEGSWYEYCPDCGVANP